MPHDKLLTQYTGRLIPPSFLDVPVTDADELEVIGTGSKLAYTSTILPTKILIKGVAMIGRVDDIVRNVMGRAEEEIRSVERQTRLRTLAYVDEER